MHFQEFSHPGDADYKEEEPEDIERPECPYGSDCYRKNPLHRKEYKHSKKPGEQHLLQADTPNTLQTHFI